MTNSEKLARWQGYKQHPNGVSCYTGELRLIGGILKWPDYLNDDEAAMSLLDTLVEKGYEYNLCDNTRRIDFRIFKNDLGVSISIKPTRREAVVAAVLELIGKEWKDGV